MGWLRRGGRWAEWPPARSSAVGVVVKEAEPLGFRGPRLLWPVPLKEGAGGGGGGGLAIVRAEEKAATMDERRSCELG